ncbi:cytochrome P450 [Bordetella sp. BOR01]|uniref:cytochrome P450 n=1 Tax=Bordetella sp. BOR01 TaxID=2854779 RepID=UPI001C488781|nr:cytochrome P450 [Bordetella sp. BOR01]MBV7481995.1 cytochrome [Bordetella sp. BOR01]
MPPTDPIQAVTHADPYPYYRMLARDRPLYHDPALDLWIASTPALIRAVLDHSAARVRPAQEPVPQALHDGAAGLLFSRFVRMSDGPGHAGLKPLLADCLLALSPTATPCWPAMPRDLPALDDFLFDAPVYAMARHLGLAQQVAPACARDVRQFRAALRPAATADNVAAGHAAAARLQATLAALLETQAGGTPLAVLRGRAAQAGIEPDVIAANLAGLLFQSCEAGAGLIGNTLVALARDPVTAAAARQDTRECLRMAAHTAQYDPPVHNTRRYLCAPIPLDGHVLPAGATVLLVLAAAGIEQPGAIPWTFGAGRHACPGHAPAIQSAGQAVSRLLQGGLDPAQLLGGPHYRPLPNARVPYFAAAA